MSVSTRSLLFLAVLSAVLFAQIRTLRADDNADLKKEPAAPAELGYLTQFLKAKPRDVTQVSAEPEVTTAEESSSRPGLAAPAVVQIPTNKAPRDRDSSATDTGRVDGTVVTDDDTSVGLADFLFGEPQILFTNTPPELAQVPATPLAPIITAERASYDIEVQPTVLDSSSNVEYMLVHDTGDGALANDPVSLAFGFDFLQPSWSNDSFLELLPGAAAALFPGLGVSSRIDHDYAVAPRFEVGLGLGNSGYGLEAGGNFLSIGGQLNQQIGTIADNQVLQATNTINIVSVNAPELSYVREICPFGHYGETEFRIGARYSTINQTFAASLRRGDGAAVTSTSSQDFGGLGLTAAFNAGTLITDRWWLYGKSRGSMVIGDNDRLATYSLIMPGGAAGSTSDTVSESRTDIIPVGEFEFGVIVDNRDTGIADDESALMWLKAGFVAQVWGGAGMISAGDNSGFRNGTLTLMGFTIQAGVAR